MNWSLFFKMSWDLACTNVMLSSFLLHPPPLKFKEILPKPPVACRKSCIDLLSAYSIDDHCPYIFNCFHDKINLIINI